MTFRQKIIFAGAAVMLFGAGAATTLMAEAAATPPAYLIVNVSEVQDPKAFQAYSDGVGATQGPYGGQVIVRAPATDLGPQHGNWSGNVTPKGRIAVIKFPSMEKLKAWEASPAYSKLRPIRENNTVGTLYAVEGLAPG